MIFSTLWYIANEFSQNDLWSRKITASFNIGYFEAESLGIHCELVVKLGLTPEPLSSRGPLEKAVSEPLQRGILESLFFLRPSSKVEGRKELLTIARPWKEIVVGWQHICFNFFQIEGAGWIYDLFRTTQNAGFYFDLIIWMLNLPLHILEFTGGYCPPTDLS